MSLASKRLAVASALPPSADEIPGVTTPRRRCVLCTRRHDAGQLGGLGGPQPLADCRVVPSA